MDARWQITAVVGFRNHYFRCVAGQRIILLLSGMAGKQSSPLVMLQFS